MQGIVCTLDGKGYLHYGDDIVMCWAHARRAISKNIPKYLKDTKSQVEFLCAYRLQVNVKNDTIEN